MDYLVSGLTGEFRRLALCRFCCRRVVFGFVVANSYSGHATTFEAAVHGFGSAADLRKARKEVQAKFPPAKVSCVRISKMSPRKVRLSPL